MLVLLSSAAFVGFVHSLAPNHWLPVVVLSKARRWSRQKSVLGAAVTASGHFLSSALMTAVIGLLGGWIAAHILKLTGETPNEVTAEALEHRLEMIFGTLLIVFGLGYAIFNFRRHSHCHGHEHHGPHAPGAQASSKKAFIFLFTLGMNPCLAVTPLILTAGTQGVMVLASTLLAYGAAVYIAMMGATFLVSVGMTRLDHPVLEHYGEVITGLGIVIAGILVMSWHQLIGAA